MLGGSNFRISERYRCVADHRGQVQGGVGFVFEGMDMLDSSKVPSFFRCRFSFAGAPFARVGKCLRCANTIAGVTTIDIWACAVYFLGFVERCI